MLIRPFLKDLLDNIEGFFTGENTEVEDQANIYNAINHLSVDEYYWWEDPDRPIDMEDFTPIDALDKEEIEFSGEKYYVVDGDIEFDDEVIGVSTKTKSNDQGLYETVKLLIEGGEVVAIEESEYAFNSSDDSVDIYD